MQGTSRGGMSARWKLALSYAGFLMVAGTLLLAVVTGSTHTRYRIARLNNLPTNILLDAIRTRRGLKWGIPAMLLAVPNLLAASTCTTFIGSGGPGWLHLLVLLFLWNAMKFISMGPISLFLLLRARVREAVTARADHEQRRTHSVVASL